MNLKSIKYIYFLGIGGIGMSAIARYFKALGKNVSGYDKTPTPLTNELIQEGIEIHFEDNINLIKSEIRNQKSEVLVVLTPAIPKEHSEWKYFTENNFTIKKRSEVLGMITKENFTIAVAGTHGKTTTTSLIAHILRDAGKNCAAFLGGIAQNYNTNLLLSQHTPHSTHHTIFVVEADEYDRSFLTLYPDIAVITSMDADHLDIYGEKKELEKSFREFALQVKQGGHLLVKKGLEIKNSLSYSVSEEADFYATKIHIKNGNFVFDFVGKNGNINEIVFQVPGRHNVENAVAAIAAAQFAGVSADEIKNALSNFKGVRRRFEYQIKSENLIYIDDYAHHPEELRACINAVKELYPNKKITGIFQPHLFSRTRDFADEFASVLDSLDECILLEIYPARELPMAGVTSQMLMDRMKNKNKILVQKNELINYLKEKNLEVLVTLGAGDIDTLVEQIKKSLCH